MPSMETTQKSYTITITFTGLMLFVKNKLFEVDVLFPKNGDDAHGQHPSHEPILYVPPDAQDAEFTFPPRQLNGLPVRLRDWDTTRLILGNAELHGRVTTFDQASVACNDGPPSRPTSWDDMRNVPRLERLFPDATARPPSDCHSSHTWYVRSGELKALCPTHPEDPELWSWIDNTTGGHCCQYLTDVVGYEYRHDGKSPLALFFQKGGKTFRLGLQTKRDISCTVVCHPPVLGRKSTEIRHLGMLADIVYAKRIDREVLPYCPPSQCPDDPLCPPATMGF